MTDSRTHHAECWRDHDDCAKRKADEALRVLKQLWNAWWDDEPRSPRSKPKRRLTVLPDSPWYQAIAAVGDLAEPGWRETCVLSAAADDPGDDAEVA